MCRFWHVFCGDFSTSYVQILARLMCRFMRELALLAWNALLALYTKYVYIWQFLFWLSSWDPRPWPRGNTTIYELRVFRANTWIPWRIFNASSLPKLVVALRVSPFWFWAFYTQTVQHRWHYKQIVKVSQKHIQIKEWTCIISRF